MLCSTDGGIQWQIRNNSMSQGWIAVQMDTQTQKGHWQVQ